MLLLSSLFNCLFCEVFWDTLLRNSSLLRQCLLLDHLFYRKMFFYSSCHKSCIVLFLFTRCFSISSLCFTCSFKSLLKVLFLFYSLCQPVLFIHYRLCYLCVCRKTLCNVYFAIQINLIIIIYLSLFCFTCMSHPLPLGSPVGYHIQSKWHKKHVKAASTAL